MTKTADAGRTFATQQSVLCNGPKTNLNQWFGTQARAWATDAQQASERHRQVALSELRVVTKRVVAPTGVEPVSIA